MEKCKICGKIVNNLNGLSRHLNKKHIDVSHEDYFNTYIGINESKCKMCGRKTSFLNIAQGYRRFCSGKCAQNSPETRDKCKQTSLQRYGAENVFASEYGKKLM